MYLNIPRRIILSARRVILYPLIPGFVLLFYELFVSSIIQLSVQNYSHQAMVSIELVVTDQQPLWNWCVIPDMNLLDGLV